MSNFKIGDVVRLKSGGPEMTVEYLATEDKVRCSWFTDNQKLKTGIFNCNCLVVAETNMYVNECCDEEPAETEPDYECKDKPFYNDFEIEFQ